MAICRWGDDAYGTSRIGCGLLASALRMSGSNLAFRFSDGTKAVGVSACWDLIKDGGGIRKLRYALPGRSKSSGIRVIYYWVKDDGQIYLLLAWRKSKIDNLSDKETALLRQFVRDL